VPETTTSVAGTTTTEETISPTTTTTGRPGGVLPAPKVTKAAGRQTLPFTGLPLWPFAAGAFCLTLLGLGLRRVAARQRA